MNFQHIPVVKSADWYVEMAYNVANRKADLLRSGLRGSLLERSKTVESGKLEVAKDALFKQLDALIVGFPSLDSLSEFYNELLSLVLGNLAHFNLSF